MTSLRPFVNDLKIIDSKSETRRLGPIKTPAQKRLLSIVEEDLRDQRPVRHIVLKARQMGFSTLIQAIVFWSAFVLPGLRGLIVAHDSDTADYLLSINKNYWETAWFKDAFTEKYAAGNRLAWVETNSIIASRSAQSKPRGKTIQAFHGSEVAWWFKAAETMKGISPSLHRHPLTFGFLESTANGMGNYFHQQWNLAVSGDSEYRPIFFGWWEHDNYAVSRIGRVDLLSDVFVQRDDEERVLYRYLRRKGLEDRDVQDKLLWRRLVVATECGGDLETFHQEYPTVPEEAFISSGSTIFPFEVLKSVYEPEKGSVGDLYRDVTGNVRFVENESGSLRVFRYPSPSAAYLIGGDPAWTATPSSDYSCAQILNRKTREQVAVWRGKCSHYDFGRQMELLGEWYNTAILAPEATKGGGVVVGYLQGVGYPHIWLHKKHGRARGQVDMSYGWSTNATTKPEAIYTLKSWFVDSANTGWGVVVHDPLTFSELKNYTQLPNGDFGPSDGSENDDAVMALAIAAICTDHEAASLYQQTQSAPSNQYVEEWAAEVGATRGPHQVGGLTPAAELFSPHDPSAPLEPWRRSQDDAASFYDFDGA